MPPKGGVKRKAHADGVSTPLSPVRAPFNATPNIVPESKMTKSLAEQLSYLHSPRPFKNPNYTKNVNRRAKNLKNVLSQERERERAERERRKLEKLEGTAMDVDVEEGEEEMPSYASIEAPPSVLPQKHYCDITGLEAPYTDPATGLRYHDKSVYDIVKSLSVSSAKAYLAARGVSSIVK